MQEKILILDFGSQYTQLIARRVRELNVYCEIHPFNRIPALDASVRGVILSGSPYSVRDKEAPRVDLSAIKGKLPLLGVCYGAQYLSHCYGGEVAPSATREYGRAMLSKTEGDNPLIRDLSERTQVWMSHGDTIVRIPESYRIIASTEDRAGRRVPDRRRADMGHPVPPGSVPLDRGQAAAEAFCRRHLRLPSGLDSRLVRRIDRPPNCAKRSKAGQSAARDCPGESTRR